MDTAADRVAAGTAAGTVVARREPEPSGAAVAASVAVAVETAVAAAWLGATWRRVAARRFGTDYVRACAEDLLAVSLAWSATRV